MVVKQSKRRLPKKPRPERNVIMVTDCVFWLVLITPAQLIIVCTTT